MLLLDVTLIHFHSTLIIIPSKLLIILSPYKQVFQKILGALQNSGRQMCDVEQVSHQGPNIVKRLVATATWRPEYLHPCVIFASLSSSSNQLFFERFCCQNYVN